MTTEQIDSVTEEEIEQHEIAAREINRLRNVSKAQSQWYTSEGDPQNPSVRPKYVYRKDSKTGNWKVLGPREGLMRAGDGYGVHVTKKSGETKEVGVGRVSKGFESDGIVLAYAEVRMGNLCPTAGNCDSLGGGSNCRFCD